MYLGIYRYDQVNLTRVYTIAKYNFSAMSQEILFQDIEIDEARNFLQGNNMVFLINWLEKWTKD